MLIAGLAILAVAIIAAGSADPEPITGPARVIDGDTLDVAGTRIRLHGIDAPEAQQSCQDSAGQPYRCGERATEALVRKIGQAAVACEARDVDRFGRVVAVCRLDGEDLSAWLVSQGWAIAYRRFSTDYVGFEEVARAERRGIWSGTFMKPERWRRG